MYSCKNDHTTFNKNEKNCQICGGIMKIHPSKNDETIKSKPINNDIQKKFFCLVCGNEIDVNRYYHRGQKCKECEND